MNPSAPIRRAIDSSLVIAAVRRTARGSVAGAAVSGIIQARPQLIDALGGEWSAVREARSHERIIALVAGSWLARQLTSILAALASAWRGGRTGRLAAAGLSAPAIARIRFGGWVAQSAVFTHVLVSAALGVHIGLAGWSVRAVIALLAWPMIQSPRKVAAAWHARSHPDPHA